MEAEETAREIGEDIYESHKAPCLDPAHLGAYSYWDSCAEVLGFGVALSAAKQGHGQAAIREV